MVKRRYSRSGRKTYRRKRTAFKKRRFMKKSTKLTKYDGIVYSKCVTCGDFTTDGTIANLAYFQAAWAAFGTSNNYYAFSEDNPEYAQMAAIYEEYKISGMKIEIELLGNVAGSTNVSMYPIMSATSLDGAVPVTATENQMSQKLDFKKYRAGNAHVKRYFNVGKYMSSKNLNQGWYKTGTYANVSPYTFFRMQTVGYGVSAPVGKWQVSWYVKFRGFKALGSPSWP